MRELEFQVGLLNGAAVGYCPQTGHLSSVSLAGTARRLERQGKLRVPPGQRGALYEALGYMDDRPEVGGKIARKIKSAAKKVVKVAKKVANSTLGKVIMSAVQVVAGPFGGAAIGAIKTGVQLAKAAKSKPKTPKQAKAKKEAVKVAPIAAKLARKKITPTQATAQAKKARVPPAKVKGAAVALRVSFSAKAGNPRAKSLMSAVQMVDKAKSQPGRLAELRAEVEAAPFDEGPGPQWADEGGGAIEPAEPQWADEQEGTIEAYDDAGELPELADEGGDGEAYDESDAESGDYDHDEDEGDYNEAEAYA